MIKQNKTKKTLLISVVILVFVIIILVGLSYTGQIIKTQEKITKLYVSSQRGIITGDNIIVKAGDMLYVSVEVGSRGSNNRVYIYKMSDSTKKRRESNIVLRKCPNICLSGKVTDGEFRTPLNWEGKYCAAILDKGTGKEVQACFDIKK